MLQRKKILYLITIIAFIYGIYLRWLNLDRPLIYDELWGILHLISKSTDKILTMFNSPNNHPLNTLFMKWTAYYWDESLMMMRLHSFIAGLAIPLLSGGTAWLLTRQRIIVALTVILCSLHPGLIYYSHVARGYSLEIMFIILFLFLILLYHAGDRKFSRRYFFICIGILLSFCLACFSQATAVLYLVPVIVVHTGYLLVIKKQEQVNTINHILTIVKTNIILICSYSLITLFSVWMYIMHYKLFQAAVPAGEGVQIHSFTDLILIITSIGSKLLPWLILAGLGGCLISRKYRILSWLGIVYVSLPLVAGIMIKFGPPRVYLPLVPIFIIISTTGFYNLAMITKVLRRQIVLLLPILLTSYMLITYQQHYFNWSEINFHKAVKWVNKHFPKGYHCYPPNVGLKISAYFPNEFKNNSQPFHDNMLFLYCGSSDTLKALDIKGRVSTINVESHKKTAMINIKNNSISANIPISFYRLKHISNVNKNASNIILANIPLQNYKVAKAKVEFLRASGSWNLLNCWFNPIKKDQAGKNSIAGGQFISDNAQNSLSKLKNIEQKSAGKIIFYKLVPMPQTEIDNIILTKVANF